MLIESLFDKNLKYSKDGKAVKEESKKPTIKRRRVKESYSHNISDLVKMIVDQDISREEIEQAFSIIESQSSAMDTLDKAFTPNTEPYYAAYLPDGSRDQEVFISNDPDQYQGYIVGIGGDVDNRYGDKVYVYLYDNDDRFSALSKEFNFYTELRKAVDLCNKLYQSITPEMDPSEVESIGKSLGLIRT